MRSPNTVDHYGGNDFENRYVLRRDKNCLRVSAKTGVSREPPGIAGMNAQIARECIPESWCHVVK